MRFNQLASELAFHRSRVSQRRPFYHPGRAGGRAAYLHALQGLLNELGEH